VTNESGVDITRDGVVLRVHLNHPASGNALSQAGIDEFVAALDEATRSNTVRVIALTAEGRHFCTGMNLVEANTSNQERPRTGHLRRRTALGANRLVKTLIEVPLPVVSGVRGWAAGIGNMLALSSDYVVASETAKLWAPFVGRGFTPDSGTSSLLPRLVGTQRAKEMVLLSRPLLAERAEQWGLVNDIVADDAVEERVEEVVQEFARAATVSVGLAKQMLNRSHEMTLEQALDREATALEISLRTADFKEGMSSLREKRDPDYRGT